MIRLIFGIVLLVLIWGFVSTWRKMRRKEKAKQELYANKDHKEELLDKFTTTEEVLDIDEQIVSSKERIAGKKANLKDRIDNIN